MWDEYTDKRLIKTHSPCMPIDFPTRRVALVTGTESSQGRCFVAHFHDISLVTDTKDMI